MRTFKGNSKDETLQSPFLKQSFFKKGVELSGTVIRIFENSNGIGYVLSLKKPVTLNGKKEKTIAIGDMAGLRMALTSAGVSELQCDDVLTLVCLGQTDTGKGNPRTDFDVDVKRPD